MISNTIKGVKQTKMWAVFAPDGNIQFRSIAHTKKQSKYLTVGYHERGEVTWETYAKNGFTVEKVLVDIKLLH